MLVNLLLIVSLVTSTAAFASSTESSLPRPELKLERTHISKASGNAAKEISGIAFSRDGLLAIADKKSDHYVYRVVFHPDGPTTAAASFELKPYVDLSQLKGYNDYLAALAKDPSLDERSRGLDLEGIAVCDTLIYLANERPRHLLEVDLQKKSLRKLPIDWSPIKELHAGGSNAGLEGVAADCKRKLIYTVKERDPRLLMQIDTERFKIAASLDLPRSDRQGQRVINPFTGQGLYEITPDFASVTVDEGFLYVLERNTYEISKLDLRSLKVVARVSYLRSEHLLFDTGEPFGTAEALALTPTQIVIGYDNNGAPLSSVSAAKLGVSGPREILMYFQRPPNF